MGLFVFVLYAEIYLIAGKSFCKTISSEVHYWIGNVQRLSERFVKNLKLEPKVGRAFYEIRPFKSKR